MLYIVRRTQLYLEDDMWNVLHARARQERTTVSELVRQAVRECYLGRLADRRHAMEAFIGIRRNRTERVDSTEYVRGLRRGNRIEKLSGQ